jgi:glycosyltransferase involved in cell wall biosynthesis
MEPSPLTILMPVFNGASFLRAAIDSILGQSFHAFQLIIIDDGSTDDTPEILSEFTDPRIRIITNPSRRGVSSCRNQALEMALTPFVTYFDADDVAHPDKFRLQIDFLQSNPEYSMVGCSVVLTDANDQRIGQWRLNFSSGRLPVEMMFRNCMVTSAVLFRRSAADGFRFPEHLDTGEDWLLWWYLLQHGNGRNLQKYLLSYRQHSKSVMQRHSAVKQVNDHRVINTITKSIGIALTDLQITMLTKLKANEPIDKAIRIPEYRDLFKIMAQGLKATGKFRYRDVLIVFAKRWLKIIYLSWNHPDSRRTAIRFSRFLLHLFSSHP